MKKIISILAIFLANNAYADDLMFKPYVGVDYDYVHANYASGVDQILDKNINGADFHAGARINQYFGIEGSYLWTADSNKTVTGLKTSVNLTGYTLDGMGYLPVTADKKLELIGTVGISRLRANVQFSGLLTGSGSEWETKGRIGTGAQYWLTDKINTRALVRYQAADFSGVVDNAIIGSIGLNYQF